MFRLGRRSKLLTLVLDDPLVGEICIAEMLRGLKPSFAFFLDLSADSQILFNGERLNKHGKGQKHWRFKDTEMSMKT